MAHLLGPPTKEVHFALDIWNVPSPLFTGLPAVMQNLPYLKRRLGLRFDRTMETILAGES
jgi:hypothetical protein